MAKALVVSLLLVALTTLAPGGGVVRAQPATTDVQVPLSGTVFYDLSEESLPLDGWLHVDAQRTLKGMNVRVNLDGVSGIGTITGIRYNAIGRDQATLPIAGSVTENFDFRIIPADGFTLSCGLQVTLTLTFSVDGALTNVVVDQLTVVH